MKKLILFSFIILAGCKKDEDVKPEPQINLTEWANFGNTTFQVDTTFIIDTI